jgi:hypothetical protein
MHGHYGTQSAAGEIDDYVEHDDRYIEKATALTHEYLQRCGLSAECVLITANRQLTHPRDRKCGGKGPSGAQTQG